MFIIYPSSRFVLLLFLCHITCPFQTEKIPPFPSASLTHNPKSKILNKVPSIRPALWVSVPFPAKAIHKHFMSHVSLGRS